MKLKDRREAGRRLATRLKHLIDLSPVVVGLPRGGVPVAFEVAQALGAPLDIFVVRKLGTPGHEELAMGAIASGGARVLVGEVIRTLGIRPEQVAQVSARQARELRAQEATYRAGRPAVELKGRTVVVVDDGLATGATMEVALQGLAARGVGRRIVAVPVAPRETVARLKDQADEVICLANPDPFIAVGLWYRDFDQTTDEEVRALLSASAAPVG